MNTPTAFEMVIVVFTLASLEAMPALSPRVCWLSFDLYGYEKWAEKCLLASALFTHVSLRVKLAISTLGSVPRDPCRVVQRFLGSEVPMDKSEVKMSAYAVYKTLQAVRPVLKFAVV